jgi:hypothetical protein
MVEEAVAGTVSLPNHKALEQIAAAFGKRPVGFAVSVRQLSGAKATANDILTAIGA